VKTARELLGRVSHTGNKVTLADVAGKDVVVLAVFSFDGRFGPAASVEVKIGDELCWFITSGVVVVEQLKMLVGQEPYLANFHKEKSATGRQYWTIA